MRRWRSDPRLPPQTSRRRSARRRKRRPADDPALAGLDLGRESDDPVLTLARSRSNPRSPETGPAPCSPRCHSRVGSSRSSGRTARYLRSHRLHAPVPSNPIIPRRLANPSACIRHSLLNPDVTREFDSFSQLAEVQARSRIHGGIHYQFDSDASQVACPKVAKYVFANFMRPRHHGSHDNDDSER
jgi:hypothetical protein